MTTKTNADALASQLRAANEQLGMVKDQLAFTTIYSDVDGVAEEVNVKVGDLFMGPGQVKIVNTTKLKLTAQVPENYAGKVKVGTELTLTFPDIQKTINNNADNDDDNTAAVLNGTIRTLRHSGREPISPRPNSICRRFDIPLTLLPSLLPGNVSLFKHRPPHLTASALRAYKFTHFATHHNVTTNSNNNAATGGGNNMSSAHGSTSTVLMPRLGFGMKNLEQDRAEQIVFQAIQLGYRRFETSQHFSKSNYLHVSLHIIYLFISNIYMTHTYNNYLLVLLHFS
jgi:hypothetical protein